MARSARPSLLFSLPRSSLCLREAGGERKAGASEGSIHQSGEAPAVTQTTLKLFSTDAKGPIKILTEWSELERSSQIFLFDNLFLTPSVFLGLSVIKHDEDRINKRLLQLDYRANKWIWTFDCAPSDKKAYTTCDYSLA